MPDVNTVACGVCGAQKKDSNHWWMVWINHLNEFCCDAFQPVPWNTIKEMYAERESGRVEVACGEGHAQKLFAHWLVSGSFLAPSQRPVSAPSASSAVKPESSPSVPLPNPTETEKPS